MNGWTLTYNEWDPAKEPLREALCTLGNGYFATRGAAEWAKAGDPHYPGTYLAGGYNRLETEVSGRTVENEDLVNWPNWLYLNFRPEGGDWFSLDSVEILEYQQELDLKRGILIRRMRFRDGEGRQTYLLTRRMTNVSCGHVGAIEWTLTPLNWSGRVEIQSELDGSVKNEGVKRYSQLNSQHLEFLESGSINKDSFYLVVQTTQSKIVMAQAARTRVYHGGTVAPTQRETYQEGAIIGQKIAFDCERQHPVRIEKMVAIYTSRDVGISEPLDATKDEVSVTGLFGEILEPHRRRWGRLWHRCDIQIGGAAETQTAVRVHIFHLLQTASPNSVQLDTGLPARGWHGEAYRGHVFWDEVYIFPFLNLSVPEITRALKMYRFRRLPKARRAARKAGYRGAMYPWQSGSDGREETQRLHLNPRSGRWLEDNTHLQRHVNASIAYDVWQYYQATDDREFMSFYGAQMYLEITKFWASMVTYSERLQRYEIRGVVGPDEYHTRYPGAKDPGLNNNAYTNIMAAWVLGTAEKVLDILAEGQKGEILEDQGIEIEELHQWKEISQKMFIPFHDGGIISQFEGYEDLQEFDWDKYREKYGDIQRLDRILEAEGDTPNRYQLAKQADVLMLFYLFSAEELEEIFTNLGYEFTPDLIPKNIEYYDKRTSHGSTLSQIVHAWVLSRSQREASWSIFKQALKSDLEDVQGGTTPEGIHLGAMAGTTDLLQRCYVGIVTRDDAIWFNPQLPDELTDVRLRVKYRGHWMSIHVNHQTLKVIVEKGGYGEVNIGFNGEIFVVQEGDMKEFELSGS